MGWRAVVASALALVLGGCTAGAPEVVPTVVPSPSRSGAAGPYQTEVRSFAFTRDGRELQTAVVAPRAPGRYPIVVFGHGLSGLPGFYTKLLEAWAAAGFVVAAPAFPRTKLGADEYQVRDVLNQPADMAAVLDGLLALDESDSLRGRLDGERVAAAGHSAGAISSLGLFTAGGAEGRDERFDAGILLAGNATGVGTRFGGPASPLLFVHAQGDKVVSAASGRAAYRAVPWPKAFLTLPGAEHTSCYISPGDPSYTTVVATTTDFLRWALLQDEAAYDRLVRTDRLEHALPEQP